MTEQKPVIILGIESSCDDTGAAVLFNGKILANIIATQQIHQKYGGVVPELASRAHQQNIVPVVAQALKEANVKANDITAVAYTQGPGLLGSLLVGSSFSKAFCLALNKPIIAVNHMHAHIHAHFIKNEQTNLIPQFPFICLTVSGGHTQIILLKNYFELEIIGETTDDAAGEAFDKAAKIVGLPYPGGPLLDKYGSIGNPLAYKLPIPNAGEYNYSFSGLKTAFFNLVNNQSSKHKNFIENNLNDLCASMQHTIVTYLLKNLKQSVINYKVNTIALAGGVSANSLLRLKFSELGQKNGWNVFIPPFEYCTDNAAMIAMSGFLKYQANNFSSQSDSAKARLEFNAPFH